MELDKDVELLIKDIINVVSKSLRTPFELYLFGSFANTRASRYSDVDIAIKTKDTLKEEDIVYLKEKLDDLRTLRKIDLVYLNKSPGLEDVVKKEGILIYESKG